MRQLWMKSLLLMAWSITSPLVSAAGFDCKQAKDVVERTICGDSQLSQLDDQLTQSFQQAHIRAGTLADVLLRDQRNWLAERNESVAFVRDPVDVYKERIQFLEHLFREPKIPSPLLQGIYSHIAVARSFSPDANGPWAALGGNGSVFHLAEERGLDEAESLPFDLGDLKTSADSDDGAKTLAFLDAMHVGGISIEAGTSHCIDWSLFSWSGRTTRAVHTPIILEDYCAEGGATGGLAEYQGRAYALQFNENATSTGDLDVQPYLKERWGMPERLEIRYDVQLLPSTFQCALPNCEELKKKADKIVAYYDKSYDVAALAEALKADDQAKFKLLQQEAEHVAMLGILPNFDGRQTYQGYFYTGFGGSGAYFPILWHGELLLGRIANGQHGAHDSLDWVLAIWRWNGHTFVPALGMVTLKERKSILLSAIVPSPYTVAEIKDQ
jgi:uncharacterized protein